MKNINEELTKWAIDKINKEYQGEISLLLAHDTLRLEEDKGEYALSFFIPETEHAYNLSKTFIIDGKGYDLYPISWNRMESFAEVKEYNTTSLADARILYAKDEACKERFEQLQKRLKKNLSNAEFMYKKSLEHLNIAMQIYQTMVFENSICNIRKASGYIIDYLAVAVADLNHTYFKTTQIYQMEELRTMKEIPAEFITLYEKIIHADGVEEIKQLCYEIINTTRQFIKEKKDNTVKSKPEANFKNLADWYQELCYTWRRIYVHCEKKDSVRVFMWGCMLQYELDIIKEEFGLEELDLLSAYGADDLTPFYNRAKKLEERIVAVIEEHGIVIDAYDNIEEFLKKNR
ncbi:hypothetical protein [Clostridium omnivorum]|uniref:Uncharacterized protein n=1 Tax=Clostridium omnivorum TaxID=1604902 RepID=A0ABQ5N4V2_9CLOT|nr:hypothetical protein [Clostridium sp. E14]GLC30254.1 hypothetical protein bsdE14_16640 [Clostridium sp. E14]